MMKTLCIVGTCRLKTFVKKLWHWRQFLGMRHPIKCPKPFLNFRLKDGDELMGDWMWHATRLKKTYIWFFYFFPLDYLHFSLKNLFVCITKKLILFDFFDQYECSQKIFYVRKWQTFSNIVRGRPRKFYQNFVFWSMVWIMHKIEKHRT